MTVRLEGVVMICTFDLDGLAQHRPAQHCYYCYSAILYVLLLFCYCCYYYYSATIFNSHSFCYCYSVIVLQLL